MFNRPPTVPLQTPTEVLYTPPEVPPVQAIGCAVASFLLPVSAFLGAFLAYPQAAGDPNETKNLKQPVYSPSGGNKASEIVYTVGLYVTDFPYGCDAGLYELFYDYGLTYDSLPSVSFELISSYTSCGGTTGSIRKFIANGADTGYRPQGISMSLIPIGYKKGGDKPTGFHGWQKVGNGGAIPPNPVIPTNDAYQSGIRIGETLNDLQRQSLADNNTALVNAFKAANAAFAKGLKNPENPKDKLPKPTDNPLPTPTPTPTPKTGLANAPKPLEPELPNPLNPSSPANPSIEQQLAYIGSLLAVVKVNTDNINQNTTASVQQANAKAGTCEAMKSDTCTLPLTNKISNAVANNPNIASDTKLNTIIRNQVAQDGVLAGIAAQIAELRATMLSNFATAFTFFKNQVIDRAVNMLNLALNIHNALMLSETVGKTLGGILDAVISLTPLQFTDATTGARTTATSALGQNASALIINIIGVDNYAKLKEDLAISNRIIKSSTNLFNGLQRILNSQSKQAQKTGVDVSNIGNALLANDVVNKNSYPKMANSQEANSALPADDADIISGKVGIIKQGIAGLNQITRAIKSNVSQIKGIQRNFSAVTDLINGESKTRKQITLQSQNDAKRKAKFKFLSIKQIKAKSK
ncbi:hypothetical protein [Pseudanabaena sp. 'Roaring Creek']|uniref:hypothetical protein n=1 Tax=Pseudanabaena sp. 'Roaring Creek' TaxID=1681830 RepID=UPI0012E2C0F4|nr:hypothetical protein [Pseudanabaena sp. 'Roaring Creek']